jgi:hypothetical protein
MPAKKATIVVPRFVICQPVRCVLTLRKSFAQTGKIPMMPPLAILATADLLRPDVLVPVGIGLGCTLLAFGAGVFVLGRSRQAAKVPAGPAPGADLDPFDKGSATDRRSAIRRSGNPVEVEVTQGDGPPAYGVVIDRSVGGLCLHLPEAVDPGTILTIRPSNASRQIPWTKIEVKSCRREASQWQLGCQFVHTPPWSIRMLFG